MPKQDLSKISKTCFDVIIIGAGLVGCAMARQFTLEGANVLVLEKGTDILDGASKGNSAILHTGFDAPPDSIEQSCIADNYQQFNDLRKKLHLPLIKSEALVLAWTEQEEAKLNGIVEKAHQNGVGDVKIITSSTILKKEPNLSSKVIAGVHVPREYVVDPWTTPYVYLLQAIENGAELLRSCEVKDGEFDGKQWQLNTSQGNFKAKTVINCAGLYGDLIDKCLIKSQNFEIRPRKGQFILYDTPAIKLLKSIILPVPNEITKGVVICQTAFGKLLVGPTAEEQQSRSDASVDTHTLEILRSKGEEMIPALAHETISATYAGIRPATEFKDFVITDHKNQNYISVGGIRSTGLSAALGIASRVFSIYSDSGNSHSSPKIIKWPKRQNQIAEILKRDWQYKGNQGIVCHCEKVSEREIQHALKEGIPVKSLEGLKRRTRVTMGRCQGFYCSARLSELTADYFDRPIALDIDSSITKTVEDSND